MAETMKTINMPNLQKSPTVLVLLLVLFLFGFGLIFVPVVMAQTVAAPQFSSPLSTLKNDMPNNIPSPIAGKGAGVHGANSPFAPLVERAGVVPWRTLTDVKTHMKNRRIVPQFGLAQMQLHRKHIKIQGFMVPLGAAEFQSRFLLASVPPTCSFCTPGGPESMVEVIVQANKPVKYTLYSVTVEGDFWVMTDDPLGLYYRLVQAKEVH